MATPTTSRPASKQYSQKSLHDYVGGPQFPSYPLTVDSNSVTRLERAHLAKSTVGQATEFDGLLTTPGALNWATGETVAVKEIQLSNIPKSDLGEIMVRTHIQSLQR